MRARYERLRDLVQAGQAGGWRHGLGVLVTRGMAAWMAAWTALPAEPQVSTAAPTDTPAAAGTASQADCVPVHFDPVPDHHQEKGGLESACVQFPPAATTAIVAVLAQLTLAHARVTTDPHHPQEDRPP
jgi:hypothetical protein